MARLVPGRIWKGLSLPVMAAMLAAGSAACSSNTTGPTVRIDDTGWSANPESIVQLGDRFSFVVDNALDVDVEFVLLRIYYGDVDDLPLVDGVVDVSQQVVYDGEDPVVAYGLYPEYGGEGADWKPWNVAGGAATTVEVGTWLGGGEPGRFAVVSYRPGAIDAGDYVVFDMTDEDGEVPQFSLEDFHPSDGQ